MSATFDAKHCVEFLMFAAELYFLGCGPSDASARLAVDASLGRLSRCASASPEEASVPVVLSCLARMRYDARGEHVEFLTGAATEGFESSAYGGLQARTNAPSSNLFSQAQLVLDVEYWMREDFDGENCMMAH